MYIYTYTYISTCIYVCSYCRSLLPAICYRIAIELESHFSTNYFHLNITPPRGEGSFRVVRSQKLGGRGSHETTGTEFN